MEGKEAGEETRFGSTAVRARRPQCSAYLVLTPDAPHPQAPLALSALSPRLRAVQCGMAVWPLGGNAASTPLLLCLPAASAPPSHAQPRSASSEEARAARGGAMIATIFALAGCGCMAWLAGLLAIPVVLKIPSTRASLGGSSSICILRLILGLNFLSQLAGFS